MGAKRLPTDRPCCRCGCAYSPELFKIDSRGYRDSWCGDCRKKNSKENGVARAIVTKKWRQNNVERVRAYRRGYCSERRKTDIAFKLLGNLRNRIRQALVNEYKISTTVELLGCSIPQLRTHLEIQFQPGMSWENYGEWHVDHKKPCAAFDLNRAEQQKECFHYTNLQPLWAEENERKNRYVQS